LAPGIPQNALSAALIAAADDLRDPKIWRKVQLTNQTALVNREIRTRIASGRASLGAKRKAAEPSEPGG
jgi:hypothetical protein